MDDAPPETDCNGLSAIVRSEFFHDVLDMDLYCFLRDEKLLGDVPVAVAARHPLQDLDLAFAKPFVRDVFSQLGSYLRRNSPLARMDLTDNVQQFFRRHAFQDITV